MSPTAAEPAPDPQLASTVTPTSPGPPSAEPAARHAAGWGAVVGLALAVGAFVALAMVAFAGPTVNPTPHDVPIGVAAPAAAAAQASAALQDRAPGAFAVRVYTDEAALREGIRSREVYGGLVAGQSGRTVLTASAASAAVAQLLSGAAQGLAAGGPAPQVVDVVPLPSSDPRGVGLAASLLPVLIGAVLPVAALTRLTSRPAYRLVGVLLAALLAGFAAAAVLHALGSLSGSYVANALALAAASGAASLGLLGLEAVSGVPGLVVGVLVLLLLGNPLSGATTAPELIAQPWQAIGRVLVPGAGVQVLRSTAFFNGAGASGPWTVLGCWAVAGLALFTLGSWRSVRRSAHAAGPQP